MKYLQLRADRISFDGSLLSASGMEVARLMESMVYSSSAVR